MKRVTSVSVFIAISFIWLELNSSVALKCQVNDGPSEEQMKRVARSCMRRLSDDQHDDKSDDDYDNGSNNNRQGGRNDQFRNQNRDLLQGRPNQLHFSKRSAMERNRQQQNDNRLNNNNNNQRNGTNQNQQQGNSKYNNNNHNQMDRQNQNDKSCVIHCFFEELNMLNNQDFPDKHKVLYVITKDIRDNELREFYTDTIQECFRFLEMEQRMDKCQFSKNLINCMAEYARVNCVDWYNHTMIFGNNNDN